MLTVLPAYGRDYKSAKAVKAHWAEGKDFVIASIMDPNDGKYINKEDADKAGITVCIRYKNKTQVVVIQPQGAVK